MKKNSQDDFTDDGTGKNINNDCQSPGNNEGGDNYNQDFTEDIEESIDRQGLNDFEGEPEIEVSKDPDIHDSDEELKRRKVDIENDISMYPQGFKSEYDRCYRDDHPDMSPIIDMFSIQNFDVDDYNLRWFDNDDEYYEDDAGNVITRPLLTCLDLIYYASDVLGHMDATDKPTLVFDDDLEFIDSWECPISERIDLYLPEKFYKNTILRNFMISKFKKHCFTLGVSMFGKYYEFGDKQSFMKKLKR
jgi:hypothetical protein